ncbi:cell surface glycoprotein 1-like [Anopheles maculipalpis]|uniref:cell surface glycoprotein 1-like n=1 Tax=Anopheles maculipalpis TaxID=1496333 RepID=UPI0021593F81|nr:cell surface glycoprotein 1-like [Anopheles maculipalpis]
MGVMLSVLVAGVGAMDLIYCLAFVSNQVTGEEPSNAIEEAPSKQLDSREQGLEQYRENLRQQIKTAPRSNVEGVTYAQDGVPYKDGYRLEPAEGAAQLDVLIEKLRILERQSQEKEHQLEQMSVQMSELERNTAEQSLIIEELRSRSVSRAHSVEPSVTYRNNLSPADVVPQIVLNEPNDSGGGADEPRPSSSKFRPIRRDDGLRRSVKRRSITSTTSLEDRAEELERLSQLEDEESAQMDDYIPIVYSRDEVDPMSRRHNISPIPESCHHHEDDERQWVPERSPEPTLAANTTRPWGDIKLEEMKEKAVIRPSRSMSIEEEDIEPPAVQLHVSESAPSNLSSHSNSPDRDRAGEPTLRRTTKEADLTSLLQQGTTESKASSSRPWTTEIIVQEDDEAMEEDYDSDGGTPGGTRTIPQFMQSKSPSPYADGQSYVAHERQPLADISNRLVPLVPTATSVSYPSRPRSPTPYDEPGSSRESTPTSLPSSPEKIPNGFVSRDSSISPHPLQHERQELPRTAPSPSPSPSPSSARSFDGDLRPGSASASVRGVTPVNDAGRKLSPLATLEVDAGTEGDTEAENDQLLSVPRTRGASSSPSPRRKHKERKRVARSVTPIDYDQTFMDSFTDQHLSVTPSELEDYINSKEAIDFVPPPLVKPPYLYPTALPSLVLTDELGTDAQFHDAMSSKSFYGQSHPHEGVTLNHRVSYVEWIKKFPDNQTSHLALEDFDSDDEEVENIIRQAGGDKPSALFPTDVPKSAGNSPQPSKPELAVTPNDVGSRSLNVDGNEFPVNLTPVYATPSPVSLVSDLSDLSQISSSSQASSQVTQPSQTLSSSLALGSPLLNSNTTHHNTSEHHFTPIASPSEQTNESSSPLSSLQSPKPTSQTNALLRPSLTVPIVASRTPSVSPLPLDISPEELVFEIGHLDGLIFEAKSREPTPSRTPSRNEQLSLLSPDELAFDIGNMGGLILGPPSHSVSPAPPTPHPSLDSSASLSPTSWDGGEQQNAAVHPAVVRNETRTNE